MDDAVVVTILDYDGTEAGRVSLQGRRLTAAEAQTLADELVEAARFVETHPRSTATQCGRVSASSDNGVESFHYCVKPLGHREGDGPSHCDYKADGSP